MRWTDERVDLMGGEPDAWRHRRLVVAPGLMLETHDRSHAVVVDTSSGARLKVSSAIYGMLSRFEVPRTADEALGTTRDGRDEACVRALVSRRLLVDADRPVPAATPARRTAPYRFCNSPRWTAAPGDAGFVVLGVPYDLGGPGSCREAPAAIRRKSLDYAYLVDFETRRPRGWFDAGRGERVLEGVPFADAGNVHVAYGEKQAASFARLQGALEEVLAADGTPLILGGDRSVVFPVARCLAAKRPLTVVLLAPESAMAESAGEAVTVHDVGRRVAALEGVASVATFGIRTDDGRTPAAVTEVTVEAARSRGCARAAAGVAASDDVLLAVDMGVLDASMPPDGTGFSLREVKDIIDGIGGCRKLVGIGLFGLDPAGAAGDLLAIAACHVALHAMAVAAAPRAAAA